MTRGKVAVVTGGTGALGRVISTAFLREGFAVGIPYIGMGGGDRDPVPFAHDPSVLLKPADLGVEQEVERFMGEVAAELGPTHTLVNAAGGYAGGSPLEGVSLEEWERMLTVNLTSCFLVCRSALRQMRGAGRGRIITIAAMPGLVPSSMRAAYAVAKRGVATLTEQIAEETRGSGITANAIAPSILLTEANLRSMPGADTSRWVPPEEVAALALYLSSDAAGSVSGNVIRVFGGV
jgi:NAD(P)-dependent dehydrogenase (short-subunit alcohol dehydrogenase family)